LRDMISQYLADGAIDQWSIWYSVSVTQQALTEVKQSQNGHTVTSSLCQFVC